MWKNTGEEGKQRIGQAEKKLGQRQKMKVAGKGADAEGEECTAGGEEKKQHAESGPLIIKVISLSCLKVLINNII